jgi:hypothetical protein
MDAIEVKVKIIMFEKRYLTMYEDGTIQFHCGELPNEIVVAADEGLYVIVDITNPDCPLQYENRTWAEIEKL